MTRIIYRAHISDHAFVALAKTSLSTALASITCVVTLACCVGCGKPKATGAKDPSQAHKLIDVKETKAISSNGETAGPSSWSAGDLDMWYQDVGSHIVVATRCSSRIVIHTDVNRNGSPDSGQDRVYALKPDGSVTSQYVRPAWATSGWGEVKTSASATIRSRSGSSELIIWKLPKEELGSTADGTDLVFEAFDERYQTSDFRPSPPFATVLRVKYSKSTGTQGKQDAPNASGESRLISGDIAKQTPPGDRAEVPVGSSVAKKVSDQKAAAEEKEKARQAEERERIRQAEEKEKTRLAEENEKAKLAEIERIRQEGERARLDNERLLREQEIARQKQQIAALTIAEQERHRPKGPSSGEIVWEGMVKGTELITIENGQANLGTVKGSLPGVLCLLQPADTKRVSIASTPSPYNQYNRMVLRVSGNGRTRVVIRWSLP